MTNHREKQEKADAFLAKETESYRKNLLWLEEAMPESFFTEVGEENALLVAHSLVGFDVQEYYSEINLRNAVIILSLDVQDNESRIYSKYQIRVVVTMQVFVSEKPLFGIEKKVRITVLFFDEFSSSPDVAFDVDRRFWQMLNETQKKTISQLITTAETSDLMQAELIKPEDYTPNSNYSLELFIACAGAPERLFVPRLFNVLTAKKLVTSNVSLTFVKGKSNEKILAFVCQLHGITGASCWQETDIELLMQELLQCRYFSTEDLFERSYQTFREAGALDFLRSAACFVHELLVHQDPNMYTLDNVREAFCYWPEIGIEIYKLFCLRFDPYRIDKTNYSELRSKLFVEIDRQDTGKELSDIRRKSVLRQSVFFIDSILKTNFFIPNKGAIAYRLNAEFFKELPKELVSRLFSRAPFGIFFIYNRDSFGFHIRFQDLARGGLRTVRLRDKEASLEESSLIFHECYQLAWTQQKKNKDIPEGGAKGILFLHPQDGANEEEKEAFLYRSQHIFIESLLSLVNCTDDGRLKEPGIVDYYGKPEYLYLGPDENMHDSMINWIAAYAIKVDYKPKSAFISSKPLAGINHKQYGVTSLGVNCCMEEALRFLHIDPTKQSFRIKMAGGPDGDVAGNQILNLHRYYPNTAHLVSLIDVSGVIYDPEGLDLAICKELFLQSKPIRFYPAEKLSEGGFLLDMHSEKQEGVHIVKLRCLKKIGGKIFEDWLSAKQAHHIARTFVHQTEAEVFIPAGGRPGTLHRSNVGDFLLPDGTPSSKVIIEGANLYLTQVARKELEEKQVIIIKDSSANKGGVICSSFEVLSCLMLSLDEFVANKDAIVTEILQKIEEYARLEMRLILKTYSETHEPCSQISEKISEQIDLYSNQIRSYLEGVVLSPDVKDPFFICLIEYMLPILLEKFPERLYDRLPDSHKKAIIASWIASKVVYLRGLDWAPSIVDVLPIICQDPRITSCTISTHYT